MSQVFTLQGFAVGFIIGLLVMTHMGYSPFIGATIGAVLGVAGYVTWMYSPLPNHNDPLMGDPGTHWGFKKND